MREPSFWYLPETEAGLAPKLLAPLAALWTAAGRLKHRLARSKEAPRPVICVGNAVAGGAGKTPVAIAVAEMLAHMGEKPAFLTRGYGGRERGPLLVDPARHGVPAVGDEALLLARHHPTVKAADRPAGAALAASEGASVIVMDDGFQNPSLRKTLSLLVVDGATGFGNSRVIPAGPLREPAEEALRRAGAVVLMGEGELPEEAAALKLPQLRAHLAPTGAVLQGPVLVFAGVARPRKIEESAKTFGYDVVRLMAFGDHHLYSDAEAGAILEETQRLNARPLTTEKDAVRLSSAPEGSARAALLAESHVMAVKAVFDDQAGLEAILKRALPKLV